MRGAEKEEKEGEGEGRGRVEKVVCKPGDTIARAVKGAGWQGGRGRGDGGRGTAN